MKDFETYFKETAELGYIQSIMSSIYYADGLPNARINELVITENGTIGIVKSLLPELVEVMVFEGQALIHNMKVVRTNEFFQVGVSDKYLGRIIDPFGIAQDHIGKVDARGLVYRHIEAAAPQVSSRVRIKKPFLTGIMAVDLLTPLGRGQRELILGDPTTGKSTISLQTIVTQAKLGTVCIYTLVGKRKSDIKRVENFLKNMNVLDKTIVMASSSSDPAPMIYLTPYCAMTLAEYFRDRGRDVLLVLDDLTTHAKFYRELSLLSRRPPGRQSYPGDIFYIQAKLAERAGNIRLKNGKEVSITLMPIAETQEGDMSGYIQTNLMAMTDGHIFLDIAEQKKARHPAVNFTLSVSRVGNQTLTSLEREVSGYLHQLLAQARKAEELGRFGVELTEQTEQILRNAAKLEVLFNQGSDIVFSKELQLIYIGLFLAGFWNDKKVEDIESDKVKIRAVSDAGALDKLKLEVSRAKTLRAFTDLMTANLVKVQQLIKRVKNEY